MGPRLALSLLLALFLFSSSGRTEENVLKVVNGRVKEVQAGEGLLLLSFLNPVNQEEEELRLHVDGGTGFEEGLDFEGLKKGMPLTVDYREDEKGEAQAVRVNEVPLSGVPIEKNPFF